MEKIKEEEEETFRRGTKTSEVQTSLDLSSAQGCERRNCEIFWKWCQSFHNVRLYVSLDSDNIIPHQYLKEGCCGL